MALGSSKGHTPEAPGEYRQYKATFHGSPPASAAQHLTSAHPPDPCTNRHLSLKDYRQEVTLRVEALNHALEGIPAERGRHHVYWDWGSWNDPHTVDIPLKNAIALFLRVKVMAHSIEASHMRHEHEWKVWQEV